MLKIIKSFDKLAFNRNNNSKLAFRKNNSNNEVNKFDINNNNMKYTKKIRNLKDEKSFKF